MQSATAFVNSYSVFVTHEYFSLHIIFLLPQLKQRECSVLVNVCFTSIESRPNVYSHSGGGITNGTTNDGHDHAQCTIARTLCFHFPLTSRVRSIIIPFFAVYIFIYEIRMFWWSEHVSLVDAVEFFECIHIFVWSKSFECSANVHVQCSCVRFVAFHLWKSVRKFHGEFSRKFIFENTLKANHRD